MDTQQDLQNRLIEFESRYEFLRSAWDRCHELLTDHGVPFYASEVYGPDLLSHRIAILIKERDTARAEVQRLQEGRQS